MLALQGEGDPACKDSSVTVALWLRIINGKAGIIESVL